MHQKCRVCASSMAEVLNLGSLPPTGFTFSAEDELRELIPLRLATCRRCGLSQLADEIKIEDLYVEGYGYFSSLNGQMLNHLSETAKRLNQMINKRGGKIERILDIASNDGSLLSKFDEILDLKFKAGIDPLIRHLPDCYPKNSFKIESFFGIENEDEKIFSIESFDLVTSLSVLYDVPDLQNFVASVNRILKPGGYWYTEQSYFVRLLEEATFDSICHEHLYYFNLRDIISVAQPAGFKVIDVLENDVNGGSLGILLQKVSSVEKLNQEASTFILRETDKYLEELIASYQSRVESKVNSLKNLLLEYLKNGRVIKGLGASTKGNVILHVLGLSNGEIESIGEVNPKKFGRVTAVGNIPIVPEDEIWKNPEKTVILILPWHFKEFFLNKTAEFVKSGGVVIFPFPEVDIVSLDNWN